MLAPLFLLAHITALGSPRISPDGTRLAFVRSHVNLKTDRRDAELVLLDIRSRAVRVLTHDRRGVDDPQWSPQDGRLAFLADDAKHVTQLWLVRFDGGEPQQITAAPQGVEQYAWRPDGRAVAFLTADGAPKRSGIAQWQDAFRVTDNAYLSAGPFLPAHLWLLQPESNPDLTWHARRITHGGWSVATGAAGSTISWSPDGTTLAYVRLPNALLGDADRSVIEEVNVATGSRTPLTGRPHFEFNPRISPGGTQVAYSYARDSDPNNVADIFLSPGRGPGTDISRSLDRNAPNYAWYPDGRALLVNGNDGTQRALWKLAIDGRATKLPLGTVNAIGNFGGSIASDGSVAFVGTTAQHPAEIYYLRPGARAPERLTNVNAFAARLPLAAVRAVQWIGPNGFHEDGVLTYPAHFNLTQFYLSHFDRLSVTDRKPSATMQKYPLVLLIHGGPTGASTTGFDELAQLMAARGWFVLRPNYRGSDNLGNDYQHAIYSDATAGPGRDIMAGLAAVENRLPIDRSRVCVSGWSYGGMMTSWLITQYQGWACAVSGAAVNDLAYDYVLADDIATDRESMPGSPFVGNNLQKYRNVSPLTFYKAVHTPTLILSDMYDVRVPAAQSYAFYHALRDNGVPVEFYEYPIHGHFPGDPVRTADLYSRWMDWIAKHVKR